MLAFEYPWMVFLLPLPFLVWWLLPAYRERKAAVRMPFFEQLATASGRKPGPGSVVMKTNVMQKLIAPLAWALLVAAMARPQWVEEPIRNVQPLRDILLVDDISQSMEAKDYRDPSGQRIDRLSAVKQVNDEFIARRKGDRIGLAVFGGAAYPQAPFTLDHDACRELLADVQIGMAGPQTVIGDAVGLAIRMFEKSKAKEKVVLLLTDGNDTGSKMPPEKAAEIAKERGITIHTIAIGDPSARGEDRVDLPTLQKIATTTGGKYFRGEDRQQLETIYSTLDKLTPENYETLSYRPKRPLFQWPLGAAALVVVVYHLGMLLLTLGRRASEEARE